jgi:uncharacterized membrane protein
MKAMAIGEVAAFLIGPVAAIGAALALGDRGFALKAAGFLLAWYFATSIALRFVHWGYSPKKHNSAR